MSRAVSRKLCRWCGAGFTARSAAAKACPACRDERNRIASRLYWHVKAGTLAKEDLRAAVAEAMIAAVDERRMKERERNCLYCGKMAYEVDASGYCLTCRLEGLDALHRATGRTSGWDRPAKPPRAPVEGGWRGRPVAGGGDFKRGTAEVAT